MNSNLLELTERLVPVSDFSQGKAGKIFNDVSVNNHEYIVLKNNQPTVVVISIEQYKNMQFRLERFERLIKLFKNMRLLQAEENRKDSPSVDFEMLAQEEGFTMEELEKLSEKEI